MNSQSVVSRLPPLEFSRLDDAYLAVDAARGYCYSLNATAGRIWELTEPPTTLWELCSRMQTEFSVEEETCQREVFALVDSLREAGLLQVASENQPQ